MYEVKRGGTVRPAIDSATLIHEPFTQWLLTSAPNPVQCFVFFPPSLWILTCTRVFRRVAQRRRKQPNRSRPN